MVSLVGIGCGVVFATYFLPNRHWQSNYAQVFTGALVALVPAIAYWMEADEWSEIRNGAVMSLTIVALIWLAIYAGNLLRKPDNGFRNQRYRSSVPGRNITFQERGGYHRYDK